MKRFYNFSYILVLLIALLLTLSSCSDGSSSDNGPVPVSLSLSHSHTADRIVSVDEAVDLSSFAFYYKATPLWTGSDFGTIVGQTAGFVKINSYRDGKDLGYFAQGKWLFEVEVRLIDQEAAEADWALFYSGSSELYISSSSYEITIPVIGQSNEDGTVSIEVMAPTVSESDTLTITYSGTASGYYSHKDFVEILKYAAEHHIRVIPEFDTPGHSRAAIKAMEKRAERTGDTSCLLSEPEDTSKYVSVQDYTDNAINVALESTYKFIETVFDGLITLYNEAGVPLEVVHVGGDEVPEGAWIGSPACQKLMAENGWDSVDRLKDYYVGRVLDIAAAKGVKVAGWQELVQNLQPENAAKLASGLGFTNVWTVSHGREELPYQFANQGLPVVISSAPNTYLDFAYNDSKLERGHNWSGYVDERRSFSLLPYSMYRSVRWDDHGKIKKIADAPNGKTPLLAKENIIGVQGQLWTETIRSFDHVTYYIFPKALGLFERGWNVSPVWEGTTVSDDPAFVDDFNKFYSIINDKELPYYQKIGISYHTN